MRKVHLSQQETDLLLETIEHTRAALVAEIARTSTRDYRTSLKEREAILEGLLYKLTVAPLAADDSRVTPLPAPPP
jgi:hypothetical protein